MSSLPQRKKTADELAALRKDLGIPVGETALAEQVEQPVEQEIAEPDPVVSERKMVRSLKRSEWQAAPSPEKPSQPSKNAQSSIPVRRRSEKELKQLRIQALGAPQASPIRSNLLPAHLVIVGLSYLSAAFQFASYYFLQLPMAAPIAAGVFSLGVAGWMFFYRQGSRHHSALILIIVLASSAFAVLHYFPQINYGS